MKPSLHSSSPTCDLADIEQPLLQATRDLPHPEPNPALDAAILFAAAERAAEVRKARAAAMEAPAAIPKTPKTSSLLERLSRWLFGNGELRGHFGQALAASVLVVVALGLVMQVNREISPGLPKSDVAMLTPPEPETALPVEAAEKMQESAAAFVARDRAGMEMAASSAALESESDRGRSAALRAPASMEQREAKTEARRTEKDKALAAIMPTPEMPESALAVEGAKAEVSMMEAAAMPAASPPILGEESRALQRPASEANRARSMVKEQKIGSEEVTTEARIDAQLKRIIELRRDKKEEEAERLLRQLRTSYPDIDIDERLRQRENGKDK
jgi:hypothetical protein